MDENSQKSVPPAVESVQPKCQQNSIPNFCVQKEKDRVNSTVCATLRLSRNLHTLCDPMSDREDIPDISTRSNCLLFVKVSFYLTEAHIYSKHFSF